VRIFFTKDKLEYLNPYTKEKEETNHKIPFIINWDYNLEKEINQFLLCKTLTDWNPKSKTPQNNAENIISFLNFSHSLNKDWKKISTFELRKWMEIQSDAGIASGSIKSRVSTINSLFKFCMSMSLTELTPFEHFELKNTRSIISGFSNKKRIKENKNFNFRQSIKEKLFNDDMPTIKDIRLFYKNLNSLDQLMSLFIIETGVRKNELLQITKEMIINMKESESGNFHTLHLDSTKIQIKYNKSRNIIISKNLRTKLMEYLISDEYLKLSSKFKKNIKNESDVLLLFISNRGTKFSDDKLNKSFKKACERSGYFKTNKKYIKPHTLRHCFASYYIANKSKLGHNIENSYMYIAERLGHESVETTKKYYVKIVNKMEEHEDIAKHSQKFIIDILG
jgi:integrase